MLIPFDQLPPSAKIWIFPIIGELDASKLEKIKTDVTSFIKDWTSHDRSLNGSAEIVYDAILILGVDEGHHGASGCSIDKMMRFIQNLEGHYNISLLLRHKIPLLVRQKVNFIDLKDIELKIQNGEMSKQDHYLDLTFTQKSDWQNQGLKSLSEGWLGKKLAKV